MKRICPFVPFTTTSSLTFIVVNRLAGQPVTSEGLFRSAAESLNPLDEIGAKVERTVVISFPIGRILFLRSIFLSSTNHYV